MKKILITGSCSYLFGNFIRKLIYEKQPYSIISLDRVKQNSLNSIYWNKNHTFHIADVRDEHIINNIFQFEKPDLVIHAADTSDSNYITTNILGTQVIINACQKYNVDKLFYISTDKVYGNTTSNLEDSKLNSNNFITASKISAETFIQSSKLNYNIIRLSNTYGPRQSSDKLIPRTIKCILNNEKIPLHGQGNRLRHWTHVFDIGSAILNIIESGKDNEIYNVSSNHEFSNLEIVHKICSIMNDSHNLISFLDKDGDDKRGMNSDKLKGLGWEPKIKFKDGINTTIEWFQANSWMLKG